MNDERQTTNFAISLEVIFMKRKAVLGFILAALLSLPPLAEASVREKTASAINYKMCYPLVTVEKNAAAQAAINEDIQKYVDSFLNQYKAGKFYHGNFSYKVQYEDDQVISLTVADYRYNQGAAHGYTNTYGLNYSKVTGEKLPLSYFVKLRPEDKMTILRQPIIDSRGERVPLEKTFATGRYISTIKISSNYYMLGDGALALIYPPYSLACYAMGTLHIDLSPQIIDYFNRKNQ